MTLLADKIAEISNTAITTGEPSVWRGLLDTQEWKVLAQYYAETNEVIVRAKRRDSGSGEPE